MRAPDVFGIVIRVFGLALSLYCLWSLLSGIALALEGLGASTAFYLREIGGIVLGIYFLKGAPIVMRFSYPNEK
jgi:hypothetical protein